MKLKARFAEIVGEQYVDDREEALEAYSRDNSLITVQRGPDLIVRPADAEQVQKILEVANETKIPVIPASSTHHFHGSVLPKMGGVLLDLRRMNRILDINLPDRLARIEPGVTWQHIQSELAKIGQRMIMPLLPPADSSVITSLLEREVPTNPRYEYGEPMTSTEVIWGSGMRFRTGSASVPGFPDRADSRGGNPEGPGTNWYRFLQGAEGTMGVVTWAIVKTEYLPTVDQVWFMTFDRLEEAIEPLYRLQRRMIGNECFLINRQVGALIFGENWPSDYARLQSCLPPYVLALVLSGPPRLPEEKLAYELKALKEVAAEFPQVKRLFPALPGVTGLERRLPGLLRNPWPAGQTYWRHLLKGGCQQLFFIAKMEAAPAYWAVVSEVAEHYGYNPKDIGLYLQPIEQGRASHLEFQFYYDPETEKRQGTIRSLYLEAARRLFAMGAFFSRPYGLLAPMVFERARGYTNTITKIKAVLDPNSIMSPGNACF
jgi:hypothetical protein